MGGLCEATASALAVILGLNLELFRACQVVNRDTKFSVEKSMEKEIPGNVFPDPAHPNGRLPLWFDGLLTKLDGQLGDIGATRWWRLKLAMFCTLCSICYATPFFTLLSPAEPPLLWNVIHLQAAHPLTPVSGLEPGSHEAKHVFRLTMPLLAKLSGVASERGQMLLLFSMQYAAGVLFFGLCFTLFQQLLQNQAAATLFTLSTAFIYPGQACFFDLFGYFDGMAMFFLLLTFVWRSPLLILGCLLAAFWVDERAIVAASYTYLWLKLRTGKAGGWRQLLLPDRHSVVVPLAIVITLGLRYWLTREHGFVLPVSADGCVGFTRFLKAERLFRLPIGIWSPLKLHWLLLGLAGICLGLHRRFALLVLSGLAVLASICVALAVVDITRSLNYVFPAVILSVGIVAKASQQRFMLGLAVVLLVLSILVPSYFVMTGADWLLPLPVKMLFSRFI